MRFGILRSALHWAPVVGWMAAIYVVSGQTGNSDNSRHLLEGLFGLSGFWLHLVNGAVRKLLHVTEYAILSALCYRALRGAHRVVPIVALAAGILIAVAYAATDELHQLTVPGREGHVADVLTDAAGAVAGAYLSYRRSQPTSGVRPVRPEE